MSISPFLHFCSSIRKSRPMSLMVRPLPRTAAWYLSILRSANIRRIFRTLFWNSQESDRVPGRRTRHGEPCEKRGLTGTAVPVPCDASSWQKENGWSGNCRSRRPPGCANPACKYTPHWIRTWNRKNGDTGVHFPSTLWEFPVGWGLRPGYPAHLKAVVSGRLSKIHCSRNPIKEGFPFENASRQYFSCRIYWPIQ